MIFTYKCKKHKEFEVSIYYMDDNYIFSDTDEVIGSDPPETVKCPECGKESERILFPGGRAPEAHVKGITDRARRRERRFNEQGFDKSEAETFYKESIEASKERMKQGYQHYKPVVADMEWFVKNGKAKRVDDARKKEKTEAGKVIRRDLAKRAKIKK